MPGVKSHSNTLEAYATLDAWSLGQSRARTMMRSTIAKTRMKSLTCLMMVCRCYTRKPTSFIKSIRRTTLSPTKICATSSFSCAVTTSKSSTIQRCCVCLTQKTPLQGNQQRLPEGCLPGQSSTGLIIHKYLDRICRGSWNFDCRPLYKHLTEVCAPKSQYMLRTSPIHAGRGL